MSTNEPNAEPRTHTPQTDVSDAEFGNLSTVGSPAPPDDEGRRRNLEALYRVPLTVTVQLGETEMTIRELLSLSPGSILELDRIAGESIDLFVNGIRVGSGEAVVVNDNYGLRISELLTPAERLANL
jgi:flagellar motor switch protein FliN/FliY